MPDYLGTSGTLGKYGNGTPQLYAENSSFMQTQPLHKVTVPPAIHTHTRSEVVGLHSYNYAFPPGLYENYWTLLRIPPINYYPRLYAEPTEYPWEEPTLGGYLGPYCTPQPAPAGYFASPVEECKGVRKRNPERGEDKVKYTIVLSDILEKKDTRTTLMIKNIPNKYNQKLLLKKIDQNHKRRYDFFYLPIDFKVFFSSSSFRTTATLGMPLLTSRPSCTCCRFTKSLTRRSGRSSTPKR